MNIQEAEQQLVFYLLSIKVEASTIKKVVQKMKSALWETVDVNEPENADMRNYYSEYLKDLPVEYHKEFNWVIARHFHQNHYPIILGIVKKWEIAQNEWYEEQEKAEREVEGELERQRYFYHEDYEYGEVPGEVTIYEDCIIVEAAGFQEGLKDKLPSGRKYLGSGQWKYPISMKEKFTAGMYFLGMPVLYADGVKKGAPTAPEQTPEQPTQQFDRDQPIPLSKAGEMVAAKINTLANYKASTWSKNGQMRIYIKDPGDAGFLVVSPEGKIDASKLTRSTPILDAAIAQLGNLKISHNNIRRA